MMRLVLLCLAAARQESASPTAIARVVELIAELKTKVEADGRTELELYDKYACWCEDTFETKGRDIAEALKQIQELDESIKGLAESTASSGVEIKRLTEAIEENKASTTSAQEMR